MLIGIYKYLLILSVVAGVLYIILKLLSAVTLKHFSAAWHYYSYLLVSTFFLFPYSILLSGFSMHFAQKPLSIIQNELRPILMANSNVQETQRAFEGSHPTYYNFDVLLYFWAAGVVIFVGSIFVQNYYLNRRIFRMCQLAEDQTILDVISSCKQKMGVRQKMPVYISTCISTPFLKGIFYPRIVLPNLSFNQEELHYIFTHELTHWKNHDAVLKCFTLTINAIHWFNPLAYFIRRDIDCFCEFNCDESVVISMNNDERRRYCELILGVLWHVADHRMKPYSAFSDEKRNIERRLKLIMKNNGSKSKMWTRILAIAMTLTFVLTGSIVAYAASDGNLGANGSSKFIFNSLNEVVADATVPTVTYNELNDYERFIFDENAISPQTTSVPTTLWSWTTDGSTYNISGSSNSATLYTNDYFKNVTGKTFNLTAGSSNRLVVDLVHKGLIVQEVVSTWTIDAGGSKKVTLKTSDLNDFPNGDNYYFRFNSSPLGKAYSVSGTFGS